jgi:anti-sigma factor RsiW
MTPSPETVSDVGEHVLDLIPGYVLDALEPAEKLAVDRHAAYCPTCASELADQRRVAAMLPFVAAPATPPPDVKAALFARIAQSQAKQSVSEPAVSVPWSQSVTLTPSVTLPASGGWIPAPSATPVAQRARRRRRISPLLSVATPLLIVIGVLGMWTIALRDSVNSNADEAASLATILATIDASSGADTASVSTVVFSSSVDMIHDMTVAPGTSGGAPTVLVKGLQDSTPVTSYVLWAFNTNGQPEEVGSLVVNENGNGQAPITLSGPPSDYQFVCVTEPGEDPTAVCTVP